MATETMSLAINFTEAFRDLVQIGIALTSERDLSTLLHRILTEAPGINFARIRNPKPGDWLTYNGSLSGNRYSDLNQINKGNVRGLGLRWVFPVDHFNLEVTPIVADRLVSMAFCWASKYLSTS